MGNYRAWFEGLCSCAMWQRFKNKKVGSKELERNERQYQDPSRGNQIQIFCLQLGAEVSRILLISQP